MNPAVQFSRDRGGHVALIAGAVMGGAALMAFAALDLHRAVSAKSHVQNAADAAALAAASVGGAGAEAAAHAAFNANVSNIPMPGVSFASRDLVVTGSRFRYVVSGEQATSGAAVVGRASIGFDIAAEAVRPQFAQTEVAIALDVTSSMGLINDWPGAVAAVRHALDVMRSGTVSGQFRVTFIPTSDRINIGAARSSWLNGAAPVSWNGCVHPREEAIGGFNFALDDDAPTGSNQFSAVLAGETLGGPGSGGYPLTCRGAIFGPTTNLDAVENELLATQMGGTGRWDEGLAWAWRSLSPKWLGHWGVPGHPSAAPSTKKILIFITDGNSEAYTYEVGADTAHSLGYNNGTQMGWDHLLDLCERVKAKGIELHVLQSGSQAHAASRLPACATSPKHYRAVTDLEDWAAAFNFAAEAFNNVRLIQ